MYHNSVSDLLPYRCPSCGSDKRFRSLIALRLHTTIVHDVQTNSKSQNYREDSDFMQSKPDNQSGKQMDILKNWEKSSSFNTSVDDMYDKYSMKIDKVLDKYDRETTEMEGKIILAKQIEELQKQKQQLNEIRSKWKAVYGMSQLVHDTDTLVKRRINQISSTGNSVSSGYSTNNSNNKKVSFSDSNKERKRDPTHEVDVSVQLAAQYKAIAITAEEKLQEKMKEEEQLKKYIEATAVKEIDAKRKLAKFMEKLLTRAERAEHELKIYQSKLGALNPSVITHHRSGSNGLQNNPSLHRISHDYLKDSGIQLSAPGSEELKRARSEQTRVTTHPSYVNDVLESSTHRNPQQLSNVQRNERKTSGIKQAIDANTFTPFSNALDENPDAAADRRVALFCVFTQLRSIDLLRCGLVCREWRDASRHPQLWSRIQFHNLRIDTKLLKMVSHWSRDTCLLSLKNVRALADEQEANISGYLEEGLEMILKSCADKLLIISIEQCDQVLTSRALWLVSCYNKHIRSVSYRSSLDPICHQVAWALGSSCRDILSLEVAPLQPCYSRGLFDNNVARLLSWCWPQLHALSFGGADVDGTGLLAVGLNCQRLKVLEIDHARGVSEESAKSVCKHGLKELHTLLFTHTPVQAPTLVCFLQALNLRSLHVTVSQRDYYTRTKYKKIKPEYARISRALLALQKNPRYKDVVDIQCS